MVTEDWRKLPAPMCTVGTPNALFGWWWADSLASLVIVYYGIGEGLHALHESAGNVALTDLEKQEVAPEAQKSVVLERIDKGKDR